MFLSEFHLYTAAAYFLIQVHLDKQYRKANKHLSLSFGDSHLRMAEVAATRNVDKLGSGCA